MPIRVLDSNLISRIAAGEVVGRPASVVKELVENSLDADASRISVEVRGGGVGLIRVADNGGGIPSDEVELAFRRHATSKIGSIDDLDSITTLGFRGEALPSIASVADVDIVTCAAGDTGGTHISLRGGEVAGRGSKGHSQGTTVNVNNLFRNVPARLKFLKSTATENSRIADVVAHYALAYPEVGFSLVIDGRNALSTPGSGRLIDSIIEVYGAEVARNMLRLDDSRKDASLPAAIGMIGSPAIGRSSRNYINLFVNRRWINSRLLAWAVEQAYQGLLMKGKHPIVVIDLALPPGEVDVNIHPAKSEVKFRQEHDVFTAVQRVVRRALISQTPVPELAEPTAVYESLSLSEQALEMKPRSQTAAIPWSSGLGQTPQKALPALRVMGQLAGSYIVAEGPDGLYLIDQHAAHERILYEQIKEQRAQRKPELQGLLEAETFQVSPQQEEVLRDRREDMAQFGFDMEPFGERTFLVRSVPSLLAQGDWKSMVRELLDSGGDKGGWAEKVMISMACHGAVKAGQVLSDDEMRELVRRLEKVSVPHTCPHGRPTMIHFGMGQLQSGFGRR